MDSKTVYNFDGAGFYTGSSEAHLSPMEEGVYLAPTNSTDVEPPAVEPGQRARWNGKKWKAVAVEIDSNEMALVKLRDFLNNNPDVAALIGGN